MGTENKIFCTAPFATMRIENVGNGVVYKPGCVYEPEGPITTLDEYLTGQEMIQHRNNLCNGTVPRETCKKCIESEKLNLTSVRQYLNQKSYFSDKLDIKVLDVFFGNTCNLMCFMCSPYSSSSLAQERKKLFKLYDKPYPHVDNTSYALDAMEKLQNLEQVDFIGGEFFLFKNNITILDKAIEKQLACRIVTNATVLTAELLDKLKQLQKLELEFSVDGVEDCYNFMRYPGNWDETQKNILTLCEHLPVARKKFVYVVQPLNILHLIQSVEVLNKFKLKTHFQDLATPTHLGWKILTEKEKQDCANFLHDKMKTAKITNSQKLLVEQFIKGFQSAKFDDKLRKNAVELLSKTLAHRKISHEAINKQIGLFQELFKEITQI